jgi:hypothetical protein
MNSLIDIEVTIFLCYVGGHISPPNYVDYCVSSTMSGEN